MSRFSPTRGKRRGVEFSKNATIEGTIFPPKRYLFDKTGTIGRVSPRSQILRSEKMNNIIYLVGLVVVVIVILSLLGLV
ncbi:hypothetical protein [Jiella mangrovi]|uniref:DUF5808 domain-containing protein n=1 Tax=Jiella mangrovi TaxID=2821407 RepID=A0ABS4BLB5_9HYPH|nr:hypothetical protein [Jiella mangrovi]MBP0617529.1 hypothetical protein [Jiella mangrovi]